MSSDLAVAAAGLMMLGYGVARRPFDVLVVGYLVGGLAALADLTRRLVATDSGYDDVLDRIAPRPTASHPGRHDDHAS